MTPGELRQLAAAAREHAKNTLSKLYAERAGLAYRQKQMKETAAAYGQPENVVDQNYPNIAGQIETIDSAVARLENTSQIALRVLRSTAR